MKIFIIDIMHLNINNLIKNNENRFNFHSFDLIKFKPMDNSVRTGIQKERITWWRTSTYFPENKFS